MLLGDNNFAAARNILASLDAMLVDFPVAQHRKERFVVWTFPEERILSFGRLRGAQHLVTHRLSLIGTDNGFTNSAFRQ